MKNKNNTKYNNCFIEDFNALINWYKKHKPDLLEERYAGLKIGDIVKTNDDEYYILYPSESYLAETGTLIPLRRVVNEINTISRIDGGKAGIQVFKCNEPVKIYGKTDFLCFESFAWEGDK